MVFTQDLGVPSDSAASIYTDGLLGAKYKMSQYIGAAVVLGGLVVVLMPEFLSTGGAGSGSSSSGDAGMQLVWAAVMALSCVPMCLSSVYKEKALGEVEIDVVYLNGWVAVFQLLVTGALVVPAAYASSLTAGANALDLAALASEAYGVTSAIEQCSSFGAAPTSSSTRS